MTWSSQWWLAATLAAAVTAGCAGSSGPPASVHAAAPDGRRYPVCATRSLTAFAFERVSGMTGEHAFVAQLGNRSHRACSVRGYPTATLRDVGGAVLPFRYVDGSGQYVGHRPPRWVNLQADDRAYVEVAKYRCDTHSYSEARTGRLVFPGGAAVQLHIPTYPHLDYCGPGDPGSTVELTPIVATESQLSP